MKAEQTWRDERVAKLKKDDSWFTLIGLHFLVEGENKFGTLESNQLVLPRYTTVEWAGSFFLENGKVRFKMERGQGASLKDKPVTAGTLAMNETLHHNHLRFLLIERGGRPAIRVRDLRTENFLNFKKLSFFEADPKMVVEATYEAFAEPKKMVIPTVIGTEDTFLVPGKLTFTLNGKTFSLIPTQESLEDEELFLIVKDLTSAKTTYGGGRFLYAPKPVNGKVTLNFNRLINPPCAYTDFATCPLPPMENWLDTELKAGERIYERAHGPKE